MGKAELIALLQNNPPPTPRTPAPCARPPTTSRTRPPMPIRPPPPPPPPPLPSVRFRPDRPRQPELMRRLEGLHTLPVPRSTVPRGSLHGGPPKQRPPPRPAPRPPPKPDTEFKPYQLKPERDGETFIEPPIEEQSNTSVDSKKLK